jgi:hypothetical protein
MAGADVGSDRGESGPIGQVSHGREEKRRDEAGGGHLSNGMLSFVLPLLYYYRTCKGPRERHSENCA